MSTRLQDLNVFKVKNKSKRRAYRIEEAIRLSKEREEAEDEVADKPSSWSRLESSRNFRIRLKAHWTGLWSNNRTIRPGRAKPGRWIVWTRHLAKPRLSSRWIVKVCWTYTNQLAGRNRTRTVDSRSHRTEPRLGLSVNSDQGELQAVNWLGLHRSNERSNLAQT